MNIVWHVVRTFYLIGLALVVPLIGIVLAHFSKDTEVTVPLVIGCLVYFAIGFWLLVTVPRNLLARLEKRVSRFKTAGFVPDREVVSVLYNRYVGFDSQARKALYVDVNDGTETLVDFDNVNAWELEVDRNRPALLKLLTRLPGLPVIGLRISRHQSEAWKAHLGNLFG